MVASAALVAALAAGCSSGPDALRASDFTPGTCRTAAPALLGLHATARHVLRSSHPNLAAANVAVTRDQKALRALHDERLHGVVVAAGYFRIRVDGNAYDPALARALDAAYADVVRGCVSPGR